MSVQNTDLNFIKDSLLVRLSACIICVIRFVDLIDLRLIFKIRRPMILCTHSTPYVEIKWTEHENADQAVRPCKRFVYSTVKITRLYDYQTWQTLFERFTRCAKVCGLFFFLFFFFSCLLCFSDAGWLGRQTPITVKLVTWIFSKYQHL